MCSAPILFEFTAEASVGHGAVRQSRPRQHIVQRTAYLGSVQGSKRFSRPSRIKLPDGQHHLAKNILLSSGDLT